MTTVQDLPTRVRTVIDALVEETVAPLLRENRNLSVRLAEEQKHSSALSRRLLAVEAELAELRVVADGLLVANKRFVKGGVG